MARIFFNKVDRRPSPFSTLSVLLAIAAILLMVLAGPGYVWGLWGEGLNSSPEISRRVLFVTIAFFASLGGLALAIVGALHAFFSTGRRRGFRTLTGTVLSLVVLIPVALLLRTAGDVPFIHDVTTDLEMPPRFLHLEPRLYDPNGPRGVQGGPFAPNYEELHRQGYPDIKPVTTPLSVGSATGLALSVAGDLGWSVVDVSAATGRLEATDITSWFGFQDNIVVRLREIEGGSQLDIRSVSVVGISDLGANAARIRNFLTAFESGASVLEE